MVKRLPARKNRPRSPRLPKRSRRSRKLSELSDALIAIHTKESIGDDNHHAAMSRLFSGAVEPLEVLKWKELYDLVEEAIDGCEDVGNTLERIVLKNEDVQTVLNSEATTLQSVMTDSGAPCWAPDPPSSGPCQVK